LPETNSSAFRTAGLPKSHAGRKLIASFALAVLLLLLMAAAKVAADSGLTSMHYVNQRGSAVLTGQKAPQFASLRSNVINLRRGPGLRYPVDWVLQRRHLPVEVTRDFKLWRAIRLQDGTAGWVHQALLTGRRSFIIVGGRKQLRQGPSASSASIAVLRSGVVGHIARCEPASAWCSVSAGGYAGFLRRSDFWGTYPGEDVTG
jgi:SH3-like domain-containing protein